MFFEPVVERLFQALTLCMLFLRQKMDGLNGPAARHVDIRMLVIAYMKMPVRLIHFTYLVEQTTRGLVKVHVRRGNTVWKVEVVNAIVNKNVSKLGTRHVKITDKNNTIGGMLLNQ